MQIINRCQRTAGEFWTGRASTGPARLLKSKRRLRQYLITTFPFVRRCADRSLSAVHPARITGGQADRGRPPRLSTGPRSCEPLGAALGRAEVPRCTECGDLSPADEVENHCATEPLMKRRSSPNLASAQAVIAQRPWRFAWCEACTTWSRTDAGGVPAGALSCEQLLNAPRYHRKADEATAERWNVEALAGLNPVAVSALCGSDEAGVLPTGLETRSSWRRWITTALPG